MEALALQKLMEENKELSAFRNKMKDDVEQSKSIVNKLVADVTKALYSPMKENTTLRNYSNYCLP